MLCLLPIMLFSNSQNIPRPIIPNKLKWGFTLFTPLRAGSVTTPTNYCLSPVTVHVGNIDDRNAEGGPGNIVHAGNEGSASSSEP